MSWSSDSMHLGNTHFISPMLAMGHEYAPCNWNSIISLVVIYGLAGASAWSPAGPPPCCSTIRHPRGHAHHSCDRESPGWTAAHRHATTKVDMDWWRPLTTQRTSVLNARDLKLCWWSWEMSFGVAIEKCACSTVARWSVPSEAKWMRSSVLPRASTIKECCI